MSALFIDAFYIFGAAVIVHLILCRFTRRSAFMKKAMAILLAALASGAYLSVGSGVGAVLFTWGLIFSFWMMYLVALISAQNSVSLRMMDEIDCSPRHTISLEELSKKYSDQDAVLSRLNTMQRNGLVEQKNGEWYQVTAKAGRIARLTLALRKFFSIEVN